MSSEPPESIATALPREQARCRELLAVYQALPAGAFGASMITAALHDAEKAAAAGDVLEILRAYENLKSCE